MAHAFDLLVNQGDLTEVFFSILLFREASRLPLNDVFQIASTT